MTTPADTLADPYLWLEDIEGERALAWVRERNARSLARLERDPRYAETESAIRAIVLAKDRIPMPTLRGGYVYNFWQDETHVRGLWRRTTLGSYETDAPEWQVLLDVDALARQEEENWVFHGASPLPPDGARCLVWLSRGGKDASVLREFDVPSLSFIEGGFTLPEAKSHASWIDRDTLFVGTDFGPGSLTESGYPRLVKVWRRGTPLSAAETVFEGAVADVSTHGAVYFRPEGNVAVVTRSPSFFEEESYLFEAGRPLHLLPFPADAQLEGFFAGLVFVQLRSDWTPAGRSFKSGAVVALPLAHVDDLTRLQLVIEPTEGVSIQGLVFTRSAVFATLLDHVKGRIVELVRAADGWRARPQAYPDHGTISVVSADDFEEAMVVHYSSFLVPASLYHAAGAGAGPVVLKRARERFDARGYVAEQAFARSADGTRVPYFLVRPERPASKATPVLLGGYGGFEISMTPSYLGDTGKVWLERGGAYALANIRGGGEYGPPWHQAALRENRVRAFEDFIAVAEDLVARGITIPARLGISGGSNGGLLVGACAVRRPDLFGAVVCEVPLLDMLRYTKLLAGASWAAEYGDPDDAAFHDLLRSYSPYHNVRPEAAYPEIFFLTSTKDDRVHPGHARKMAARLEEMGHPYLYYENIEGGHGAAANLEQHIHRRTLQFVYLYQKLMDAR